MQARFALRFPSLLRYRLSVDQARAELRRRLADREEAFLRLVERGVFGFRKSPYLPLFAHAGCELGDLQALVRERGLDTALAELRRGGVWVSYEEFKGRAPMVRGGREIALSPGAFDNPFLEAAYGRTTGGSTGAGTRVMTDIDNLRAKAARQVLTDEIQGLRGVPMGVWRGVLPDNGLGMMLSRLPSGQVPEKWFTPVTRGALRPSFEYRLAQEYVLLVSRVFGVPMPRPEPVPIEDANRVAQWVARTLAERGACHLRAYVSLLVRVAQAAMAAGLDLSGAVLAGAGEPPTAAKVAEIRRSGARYRASYHVSEIGQVGVSCERGLDVNDHHFCQDHLALVQHRRSVPGTDVEVDAFLFTTLLPSAPKLAINVESDDYGIVEGRSCGCPWEAEGLPVHVRGIRSFRKLTGEGMTLVASDVLRLLEEELPARFGGSSTDYQLVEEEDAGGRTRLSLVVSPRVSLVSERAVLGALLEGIGSGSPAANMARATWAAAGTLRVVRREPSWTGRGKLMPLHLAARGSHAGVTEVQATDVPQ